MKKDISIVLSGEAGQGIRTVELLINKALKNSGYNVFSTSEFMSRVRGGNNTTEIRVSKKAFETDKFPLGVIYTNDENKTFENNLVVYKKDNRPLYKREVNPEKAEKLLLFN